MTQRSGSPAASPRRLRRVVAAAAAVGLASTAIVAAGGGNAAAAALPKAQSVGRLLDGALGGNPIQSIADVQDARAKSPGTTSSQNPLDVKLLNQLNLPLSNLINIPTNPAVDAGVVNQVATANANGKSVGAAGAVADDGGASLGDDNDGEPAFGTVNLTGAALSNISIPGLPAVPGLPSLPGTGGGSLDALGGVTATLGALYARAATARGGEVQTPSSGIASVNLSIGSPALGALLSQLKGLLSTSALNGILGAVPGLTAAIAALTGGNATACTFTSPTVPDITLAGGGVVLDTDDATITVNLQKLVKQLLDLDISNLSTSNFDLVSFLVKNLPKILSTGLANLVTSITTPLENAFKACVAVLPAPLQTLVNAVLGLVDQGQTTLLGAINTLSEQFSSAATGPLGQLADGLKNIIDIGLNVQSGPGIQKRDSDYPFESNLEATPNQSTPVVEDQTVVRAIEIQVLNAAAVPGGLPSLPGLNSAKVTKLTANGAAARPLAKAPGDGVLNLALANAAAGPSTLASVVVPSESTSVPPTVVPATNIPTGIPAGQAAGSHEEGLPVLPLVAILMLLTVSGGALWQYRMRGLHQR